MNELAGKTALVTGPSKGIGGGIATAFAAAGACVAVDYARDRDGAERVASEITAAGGNADRATFKILVVAGGLEPPTLGL